jgi:hypothetical protein
MNDNFDGEAEEHWDYVEHVIEWTLKLKSVDDEEIARLLDFARNIYIPALIHGFKHGIVSKLLEKETCP